MTFRLALILAVAVLAGCGDREPGAEATGHRCVEIPNGLVACTPLPPRPAPSPP